MAAARQTAPTDVSFIRPTQVAKFAEIEDFHQVVMDLDQKELYGLRLCALDLR